MRKNKNALKKRLVFSCKRRLFVENRAEYRNGGNGITSLQTNRIYRHINGLKHNGSLSQAMDMFLWLNL